MTITQFIASLRKAGRPFRMSEDRVRDTRLYHFTFGDRELVLEETPNVLYSVSEFHNPVSDLTGFSAAPQHRYRSSAAFGVKLSGISRQLIGAKRLSPKQVRTSATRMRDELTEESSAASRDPKAAVRKAKSQKAEVKVRVSREPA